MLVGCSTLDNVLHRMKPPPMPPKPIGDPIRGETLFRVGVNDAPPCSTCHQIGQGAIGMSLAPNLAGIVTRAKERDPLLPPEEYIIQSILEPERYKVTGFRVSMYADYATHLTPQDLADLVAYLMSL